MDGERVTAHRVARFLPVSRLPSPVSRLPSPVSRLPSPVSRAVQHGALAQPFAAEPGPGRSQLARARRQARRLWATPTDLGACWARTASATSTAFLEVCTCAGVHVWFVFHGPQMLRGQAAVGGNYGPWKWE